MAIQVQFRRGNTAQNNAFTGAVGEITVDTDVDTLRVHDGSTAGGTIVVTTAATQTLTNKTLGAFTTTGNITGDANVSGVAIVTGNVTGGNLITAGLVSAGTTVTATGNVTGGNLITAGLVSLSSITKTGSNGVGNIGSSTSVFNTVFAKATSAQYADLAEMYEADAVYEPGTVVSFGGTHEITQSDRDADTRVAGVISTNPSYIMNAVCNGEHAVAVALTGKVPTRVTGPVRKGDMMISNGDGTARAEPAPRIGTVLGKAIEDFDGVSGVIDVVVGRL